MTWTAFLQETSSLPSVLFASFFLLVGMQGFSHCQLSAQVLLSLIIFPRYTLDRKDGAILFEQSAANLRETEHGSWALAFPVRQGLECGQLFRHKWAPESSTNVIMFSPSSWLNNLPSKHHSQTLIGEVYPLCSSDAPPPPLYLHWMQHERKVRPARAVGNTAVTVCLDWLEVRCAGLLNYPW